MTECPTENDLRNYSIGDLPSFPVERLESHLASCDTCLTKLDQIGTDTRSILRIAQQSPIDNPRSRLLSEIRVPAELQVGAWIGNYRILDSIAKGGVGAVYRCSHPRLEQHVAIKVLRSEFQQPSHMARFQAECHALMRMKHPNIASVLDSGTSNTGTYLVMELLSGLPLCRFADEHRLSLMQRIELMIKVCRGIQHAHQKGVIHRDIKPSNILVSEVDGQGVPKIIDFGIARETLVDDGMTEPGYLIGTPRYMSPEQASMDRSLIDTRSDIFSLGSLLFELLSGVPAFARKDHPSTMHVLIQIVSGPTPQMADAFLEEPSNREVAKSRAESFERLSRSLRGELQWIVDRCLQKNPAQRYPTVDALIQDLEGYLRGDMLSVAPEALIYRTKKWLQRHRLATLMGCVLIGVLAFGTFSYFTIRTSLNRERIAQQESASRYEQTKKAVDEFYLQVAENEELKQPRMNTLRKQLLQQALEYYRDFESQNRSDRTLLRDSALAQFRLAQIHEGLGDYDQAAEYASLSLESNERFAKVPGNTTLASFHRARCLLERGQIHRLAKRIDEAGKDVALAVEGLESLLAAHSQPEPIARIELQRELGNALSIQATIQRLSHEFEAAQRGLSRAVQLRQEVLKSNPENPTDLRRYAQTMGNLANLLHTIQRADQALPMMKEVASSYSQLVERQSNSIPDLLGVAKSYGDMAGVHNTLGHLQEAIRADEIAVATFQRVVDLDPSTADYRENLARANRFLAFLYAANGDDQSAEECLLSQARELATLTERVPASTQFLKDLAKSYLERGKFYHAREQHSQAIQAFDLALNAYRELLQRSPDDPYPKVYQWIAAQKGIDSSRAVAVARLDEFVQLESNLRERVEREVPDQDSKLQMMEMEDQFYAALFLKKNASPPPVNSGEGHE